MPAAQCWKGSSSPKHLCYRVLQNYATVATESAGYVLYRALVNFSLAGVPLLIEGCSYLRVAFINLGATPLGDIDMMGSFFKINLEIDDQPSQLGDVFIMQTFMACDCNHAYLVMFAHACSYYSRAVLFFCRALLQYL